MLNTTRPAVDDGEAQTSQTELLDHHISLMKEVQDKICEIEVSSPKYIVRYITNVYTLYSVWCEVVPHYPSRAGGMSLHNQSSSLMSMVK